MAAELMAFGLEFTAAVTVALVVVLVLRPLTRSLFGARAAYCLWLLVPAMVLAIALPRAVTPAPAEDIAAAPAAAAANQRPEATDRVDQAPAIVQPERGPDVQDLTAPLLALWALGAAAYAALLAIGQYRFLRELGPLRAERRADGRVFHATRPDVGPALVGALRPRVVLPGDFARRFSPEEQSVVLAHERVHLAGGDAQINLLVAVMRVALWFHPLVHIAARLIREDQELACDETVIARHPGARRLYAEAMLKAQLAGAPVPLGCHWLAGGKAELRRRIARLARTPGRLRRGAGAVLAAGLALGGGVAAWAAQPPVPARSVATREASPATSALMRAIEDGRVSEAGNLVRSGADVNGSTVAEGSPLILAVRAGELSLVRLLLDRGADANQAVAGDGTPLIVAADNGDLAVTRLLIERGADPNRASHGDGNPLIAASAGGHVEVVDLLLAAGARVDAAVAGDETALINAARRGHLRVVQRLVEAGADVNLAVMAPRFEGPPERRSPLGMARRSGRADIVDYLIAHGARA